MPEMKRDRGTVAESEIALDKVGLFGTCGNSHWRDAVMQEFDRQGIQYFNPVVPNWNPECAKIEANNLAHDKAILFVVTSETEGYGSLAETGWAENSTERSGRRAFFVVEDFKEGDALNPKHPANRARALVRAHAAEQKVPIYPDVKAAVQAVEEYMKGKDPEKN
jgi:hypothetical protein